MVTDVCAASSEWSHLSLSIFSWAQVFSSIFSRTQVISSIFSRVQGRAQWKVNDALLHSWVGRGRVEVGNQDHTRSFSPATCRPTR